MRPSLALSALCLLGCAAEDLSEPPLPEDEEAPVDADPIARRYQTPHTQRGIFAGDLDGDGRADLAFKREAGWWAFDYASNGFGQRDEAAAGRGGLETQGAFADYDGDGIMDLGIFTDGGGWLVEYARPGTSWGTWDLDIPDRGGDAGFPVPVPADYDGDTRADLAVTTELGNWYIDYSLDGLGLDDPQRTWDVVVGGGYLGTNNYPVPGDYDGDRRADISIKDAGGVWRVDYAINGFGSWDASYPAYGGSWSVPVPADYDGDGRIDLSVKDDGGSWYIDYAKDGFGGWNIWDDGYGDRSWFPMPADYDDSGAGGTADLAVHRMCGDWFIDHTANGYGNFDVNARTLNRDASQNRRVVFSAQELADALDSPFLGTLVVPYGLTLNLAGHDELPVQSCVAIQGTGTGLAPRPVLYNDDDEPRGHDDKGHAIGFTQLRVMGNGVHIDRLHLRGPAEGRREDQPLSLAIAVSLYPERSSSDIRIGDNELTQWPLGAVALTGPVHVEQGATDAPYGTPLLTSADAAGIRVERNYIHENAHNERGYGVVIGAGAYGTIDGNVFDYNRHAIASDGSPHSGYIATRNYVLQGGYTEGTWPFHYYNQHFDIHGWKTGGYGGIAGEYHDISYNTFRGDQTYDAVMTRPALMVRGEPTMGAWFHHNTAVHDDCDAAVRRKGEVAIYNVYCTDNQLGVDASTELGVGDFDGDGLDDLFVATGAAWYASYGGVTEWRLLRASTLRLAQLKIGRFDGDTRSDVFAVEGTAWRYYPSGSGEPITLRTDSVSPAGFLYGDVDGNGMTDVLQVVGSSIRWSKDARAAFVQRALRPSYTLASNLRVANLDGDAFDDLFIANNNAWSWLSRGQGTWQHLNEPLTTSSTSLVLVDVTGDRRADVLRRSGNDWQMSVSGAGPWQIARGPGGSSSAYNEPRKAVFGNFDGVVGNEAIRWQQLWYCDPGSNLCSWTDATRPARWVYGWGDAFQTYGAPALR